MAKPKKKNLIKTSGTKTVKKNAARVGKKALTKKR